MFYEEKKKQDLEVAPEAEDEGTLTSLIDTSLCEKVAVIPSAKSTSIEKGGQNLRNNRPAAQTHSLSRISEDFSVIINVFANACTFFSLLYFVDLFVVLGGDGIIQDQVEITHNLGMCALLFGTLGFWLQFFQRSSRALFISVAICVFGAVGVIFKLNAAATAICVISATVSFLFLSVVGYHTRLALPKTFSSQPRIWTQLAICLLVGLLALNYRLIVPFVHSMVSGQPILSLQCFLFLAVGLPCTFLTFKTRATSWLACFATNIIFQLPILWGLASIFTYTVLLPIFVTVLAEVGGNSKDICHLFDQLGGRLGLLQSVGESMCLFCVVAMNLAWTAAGSQAGIVLHRRFRNRIAN